LPIDHPANAVFPLPGLPEVGAFEAIALLVQCPTMILQPSTVA
jgi:hypothetical protein